MLIFTQKRVNFYLEINEMMSWISSKETILMTKDEYQDFDHVELLQKKFDDFQKVSNLYAILLTQHFPAFYKFY